MWFRIELDKSGAILQCAHVEMSGTSRGRVRFVEADSEAEACDRAISLYRRCNAAARVRMANVRARRRAEGKCAKCEQLASVGKTLCKKHIALSAANEARKAAGLTLDRRYPSEDLAAEAMRAKAAKSSKRRLFKSGGQVATTRLLLLKRLDRLGCVAFRAWLVSEIERFRAKHGAQPESKEQ